MCITDIVRVLPTDANPHNPILTPGTSRHRRRCTGLRPILGPGGPATWHEVIRRWRRVALEGEGGVGHVECFGYAAVCDFSVNHVDAFCKCRVVLACLAPSFVGQRYGIGQSGVGERHCRRERYGAGYVGHGVVYYSVDNLGRFGVGGGMRGLKASALVDGHVDHHCARTHDLEHVGCDEVRRFCTGNQH